jgi:hypothetical protein
LRSQKKKRRKSVRSFNKRTNFPHFEFIPAGYNIDRRFKWRQAMYAHMKIMLLKQTKRQFVLSFFHTILL